MGCRKLEKNLNRRGTVRQPFPQPCIFYKRFISEFVGRIFAESLPRARKERKIAPQASAGDPLALNSRPAIRKAQGGRGRKASEKSPIPPPPVAREQRLMIAGKMTFLPGPGNDWAF